VEMLSTTFPIIMCPLRFGYITY